MGIVLGRIVPSRSRGGKLLRYAAPGKASDRHHDGGENNASKSRNTSTNHHRPTITPRDGGRTSREMVKELVMGVDAIPSNTVTTKDEVGMDEMVETASLVNRNFIRVIIGGEAYLALLDPGATVSLVGPKILKKY